MNINTGMRRKREASRHEDQWAVLDVTKSRQSASSKGTIRNANETAESFKKPILLPFTTCLKRMPFLRTQNSIRDSFEKLYQQLRNNNVEFMSPSQIFMSYKKFCTCETKL